MLPAVPEHRLALPRSPGHPHAGCRESNVLSVGQQEAKTLKLLLLLLCLALPDRSTVTASDDANWPQFRGPNGAGVRQAFRPPVYIMADQPVWKTPLPPGKSSPLVWGGRIFLTGVEGERLVTLALDAKSGELRWKQQAPETRLAAMHPANSPAASTPCADGQRLYVYFASYGLLCYDHDGRELWRKPIPTPQNMYGASTSPILHEQRLILVLDDDADLADSKLSRSKIIALDQATGELVWETARPYNRSAWSTPMIWTHEQGTDLVVLGDGRAYGYEPATGAEKWFVSGFAREPIAVPIAGTIAGTGQLYLSVAMQGGRGDAQLDPEPFWKAMLHFDRDGDGRIGRDEITEYFTLPFRPELPPEHPGFGLPLATDPRVRRDSQHRIFDWRDTNRDGYWTREEFIADMTVGRGRPCLAAVRPGGTGDITDSHVRWTLRSSIPEIPSPIFHADRLYLVRDGGLLTCVNASSGEMIYRQRLAATGQYSASPLIAGEHLYLLSAAGTLTVVKTGDDLQIVHSADLEAAVSATPAMDATSLYVRTDEAILAFR